MSKPIINTPILIIDDHEPNCVSLKKELSELAECKVETTTDVMKAKDVMKRAERLLVVLDMALVPGEQELDSGFHVLDWMRDNGLFLEKKCQVVAVSAYFLNPGAHIREDEERHNYDKVLQRVYSAGASVARSKPNINLLPELIRLDAGSAPVLDISKHIDELSGIELGQIGWRQFEEWCLKTIHILFFRQLSNIELNPNKQATQRRDIVGTVKDSTGVWGRIYEDYGTRQVSFEIKNQKGLGRDEYRQMLSYLTREYGNCGFIITRDDSQDLTTGSKELRWTKEMYDKHEKLVVRLSQKFLVDCLSEARNPRKHDDDAGIYLGKIIDTYVRLYVSGNTA